MLIERILANGSAVIRPVLVPGPSPGARPGRASPLPAAQPIVLQLCSVNSRGRFPGIHGARNGSRRFEKDSPLAQIFFIINIMLNASI
jgi:hypothetical protein